MRGGEEGRRRLGLPRVQGVFGEGAGGWQLRLVQGSVWSPQWEAVAISLVSVVNCQLGSWSVTNPLWVSVSPAMKQRDWTRQASTVASGSTPMTFWPV